MRDEKAIRQRVEEFRGQFLQWGAPKLHGFVIRKNELRGWIRAIEWVLGSQTFWEPLSTEPGTHGGYSGERQNSCRRSPRPQWGQIVASFETSRPHFGHLTNFFSALTPPREEAPFPGESPTSCRLRCRSSQIR